MLKAYYELTKPGIIYGNLLTATGGIFLASHGNLHGEVLAATLFGLSLIIASACVLNNYVDRDIDAFMERTKKRALPMGLIPLHHALLFAFFLGVSGAVLLYVYTTLLALCVALAGVGIYLLLYSPLKRRTVYATEIGALAGAVPPVVGYTAVSNSLDLTAALLFLTLALWQVPHFYAIAVYRLKEYQAAHIPVFPSRKGMLRTKIHIALYIVAFTIAAQMLYVSGATSSAYLWITGLASSIWLGLALQGFAVHDERVWARGVFLYSLVVLTLWCIMLIIG